jgi:ubiquinone/menaquinone biosynthesis C-methylase UbiE
MNSDDKSWMLARYDERLAKFGDDIRTLGSGTVERRRLRFQILREIGITNGASVLDVGCGFGDYFGFLSEHGVTVDYLGVDINPKLLDIARRKYPTAKFLQADILTDEITVADYVVASGTVNLALRSADNYEYVDRMLRRAFSLARRGVAMDFHTSYVDFRVDDIFYYEPEKVFAAAKAITKRVQLRHDYPLFEFCLYLFPDFEGWSTDRESR